MQPKTTTKNFFCQQTILKKTPINNYLNAKTFENKSHFFNKNPKQKREQISPSPLKAFFKLKNYLPSFALAI